MKIVACRKLEDCFDGSIVYGYEFSLSWDQDSVQILRCFGELEYFADFPRPLFRVIRKDGLFIKGVAGSNQCRVILPRQETAQAKQTFEDAFGWTEQPCEANASRCAIG
jgi:hypothetical protein